MNIDELIYPNVYVCSATVLSKEADLFEGAATSYNVVVAVEIEDKTVRAYYTAYPDYRKPKLEEIRVRHGKIAAVEYYLTRRAVEWEINRIIDRVIEDYDTAEAGD